MRPETKERADTIIGSVLRGSFTFYQATAGDMRWGWGGGGREMETESNGKRVGEVRRQQEKKKKKMLVCKHVSEAEMISLAELSLRGVEP